MKTSLLYIEEMSIYEILSIVSTSSMEFMANRISSDDIVEVIKICEQEIIRRINK